MRKNSLDLRRAAAGLILAAALAVLSACGGKPYDPPVAGEIKPGPGLFSGKTGGLQIIGKKKAEDEG